MIISRNTIKALPTAWSAQSQSQGLSTRRKAVVARMCCSPLMMTCLQVDKRRRNWPELREVARESLCVRVHALRPCSARVTSQNKVIRWAVCSCNESSSTTTSITSEQGWIRHPIMITVHVTTSLFMDYLSCSLRLMASTKKEEPGKRVGTCHTSCSCRMTLKHRLLLAVAL